jgi:membrane-bound lytic murein transglycosylase A
MLAGWSQIDARGALNAFVESCRRIENRPDAAPMSPNAAYAGTAGDWRGVCLEAAMLAPAQPDESSARTFFERNFKPLNWRPSGRLTGYYEPYLEVRNQPDPEFSMAIRARPNDLLTGDLGQFIAGLDGQRIVGRASNQSFEPYRSREEIERSAVGAGRCATASPGAKASAMA